MLAILFLLFQLSSSCEVKQQSNDQTTPCQFPFILGNTTYYGCTTYLDPDGKLWCSTRTNDQSEHIGQKSFWGYCLNPSCPNDEQIKNEALKAETSLEKLKIDNRNAGGCPCTPFRNCPWSSQLMEYVVNLPKYHPARTSLVNYIGANTCNSTAQAVFCCNPVNQETSTEIPKTTPRSRTTTIQDLGTWQPKQGECGSKITQTNIFGGKDTKQGEIPFMALFGYEQNGEVYYLCGGSIINKWYVLTAAHCLLSKSGNLQIPKEIVLGEHVIGQNPDCNGFGCLAKTFTRSVQKHTVHENYNSSIVGSPYDLALIRLNQSVPMFNSQNPQESGVTPVCLPWAANDPGRALTTQADLLVTGWGRVTNNRRKTNANFRQFKASTRTLKKLKVPAVSRKKCNEIEIFKNLNTDLQICAGGVEGEDSCNGDSGGPLVYRPNPDSPWYQVGIVSYGTSKCGTGQPGVYTRLSPFISWIQSHLED